VWLAGGDPGRTRSRSAHVKVSLAQPRDWRYCSPKRSRRSASWSSEPKFVGGQRYVLDDREEQFGLVEPGDVDRQVMSGAFSQARRARAPAAKCLHTGRSGWIRTTDLTIMSRAPPCERRNRMGTRGREIPANERLSRPSGRRVPPRLFALVDPWWTLRDAAGRSATELVRAGQPGAGTHRRSDALPRERDAGREAWPGSDALRAAARRLLPPRHGTAHA
jgi:hypothetical protein